MIPPSKNIYSDHLANKEDEVDWRVENAVTEVKNEGTCGACWAFATAAAIEGAWSLSIGVLNSYSPQQILDCTAPYGNNGCNGGMIDSSYQYIIDNGGIDTWDAYPYEGNSGSSCRYKNSSVGAYISGFKDIESGSEEALESAVLNVGPVSTNVDASKPSFQFYSSGVYFEPNCAKVSLDHQVNIVGFGTLDDGKQYYIVKNMWGADWGMDGYILMSRNKGNNCGIATAASFPIV